MTSTTDGAPVAEVMVSVLGLKRANVAMGGAATVDVRTRIENIGTGPVSFNATSLGLMSGDLREFGAPFLVPTGDVQLEPGESVTAQAMFPLPGEGQVGSVDLDGLKVDWTVTADDRPVPGSVTFTRRPVTRTRYVYRNDPYWWSWNRRPDRDCR